ncbi:PREDICTED: uncharacterized protein LOC104720437 [Camelina sativa]|uniref:Uncharacterized protein LOC104720437 n=1 Tax=Camelina sativa TaxID=90675 RepID=A0ABM0U6H6_CAMSA|nr:PREDICTED: uncharacterized protein LOC104720437 [Camelina sativa]
MEVNTREEYPYQDSSAWLVQYLDHQGDWLEKTRGNLVVAATVIAAMSFGVMVNPPGGVWQSDEDCSLQPLKTKTCNGMAVTSILEHNPSKRFFYLGMVISNLVSFSASMGIILLVVIGFRFRNRLIMATMVFFMVVAVLCTSAAFFFAAALVQHQDEFIKKILIFYLGFWVVLPVLILLIQLVRFLWWLIRFICCGFRRLRSTRQLLPLALTHVP